MEENKQKLKNILSQMNSLRLEKSRYHALKMLCKDMLSIINDMHNAATEEDEKRRLWGIYLALSHTNGKEVEYVQYHEDQMKGRNVAKVREKEYYDALDKAIGMIHMDIATLI
jgi:hypothetical protein